MQMRIADEYESLSDYITNVLKGIKKLEQNQMQLDGPAKDKLLALHDRVAAYIARVNEYMKDESVDHLAWANTEGAAIAELMKESRRQHLERLQKEEVSPLFSLAYTDMLNFYRRMSTATPILPLCSRGPVNNTIAPPFFFFGGRAPNRSPKVIFFTVLSGSMCVST